MDTKIGYLRELREDLLEAAWRESLTPERKRPKRRGVRRAFVGALAAATLTVAGVVGYVATHQSDEMKRLDAGSAGSNADLYARDPSAAVPSAEPQSAKVPGLSYDSGDVALREQAVTNSNRTWSSAGAGASQGNDSAQAGPAPSGSTTSSSAALPASIDNIIKTGSLSVVVPKGDFQSSLRAANDVAANYGGYVQASSTTGTRSGRLTLRVPADKYEAALGDLQDLGRVERESSNGQDVTGTFIDLQARLKIAEQRETVVSRLMDRANGISQVLQYRNLLEDAQLNVEQLKGQLRVLRNRSSLGTITLSLREEGVAAEDAVSNPSIGSALKHSLEGFLRVLFAVIVGLGYLIPIAALAGAGWWLFRRVRRSV